MLADKTHNELKWFFVSNVCKSTSGEPKSEYQGIKFKELQCTQESQYPNGTAHGNSSEHIRDRRY